MFSYCIKLNIQFYFYQKIKKMMTTLRLLRDTKTPLLNTEHTTYNQNTDTKQAKKTPKVAIFRAVVPVKFLLNG